MSGDEDKQDHIVQPTTTTTTSTHSFGVDNETLTIRVIEHMEEEFGMFVWPCSIALAEYVWQQPLRFNGVSVVEVRLLWQTLASVSFDLQFTHLMKLGAGTALPGMVAAKLGSNVTLTDNSSRVEVLENMKRTCELNAINCMVLGLTWGEWEDPIFSLQPKIVLGADVLYDTKDFDDLFATVTFLLQNSPDSVFITTYHSRSGHHLIEYLMVKWSLKCVRLVDAYSFMPPSKASCLTGSIQLAEIMYDNENSRIRQHPGSEEQMNWSFCFIYATGAS